MSPQTYIMIPILWMRKSRRRQVDLATFTVIMLDSYSRFSLEPQFVSLYPAVQPVSSRVPLDASGSRKHTDHTETNTLLSRGSWFISCPSPFSACICKKRKYYRLVLTNTLQHSAPAPPIHVLFACEILSFHPHGSQSLNSFQQNRKSQSPKSRLNII